MRSRHERTIVGPTTLRMSNSLVKGAPNNMTLFFVHAV
jgi:hypothetical protein